MIERERKCHQRPPGVADHNRPVDAEQFERLKQQQGLSRGGPGAAARSLAVAEPWTVKGNSMIAARRLVHDVADDEVVQHGAITMQEHDRPALAALHVVQPCSTWADETTQRWVPAFGLLGMPLGDQGSARQTNAG